jgi:CO/xanthine dehydrogenase FAD-binding subunit
MRPFRYHRPATLPEALDLLVRPDSAAVPLAGGTDLLIALRAGSVRPSDVVDLKAVDGLGPRIEVIDGRLIVGGGTTMTSLMADPIVRRDFPALAEAAAVVGSVQIRNRATLAGNLCNASPAADTAPALLVYGAVAVAAGPDGERRIPVDDLFVRSGVTTLRAGELLVRLELPMPSGRRGSVHLRRTRRRGHDLAAVTLACSVDEAGVTRIAYGSVGPRPVLAVDGDGVLAGHPADDAAREAVLDRILSAAAPSPTSMRAGPEYRRAMLRVLAERGVATAVARRDGETRA